MPFYEYECQACKFYMEVMQKITDAPLTECPSCGKRQLKKLVSAPVFRLKGGGWYETDFKSDKENKRNLVGAEKEEAKTDSKTEPKEAKPGEAKEAKPQAKATDTKAAEPKSAARSRVAVSARPKRAGARRPTKGPRGRGGRRGRR